MLEQVWSAPAEVLDRATYHRDADKEEERLTGVIWKLERQQFVQERDDPAWEAFVAGDWARVLEVYESERDQIREVVRDEARRGVEFRRLRIVEHPPNAYLRWELPSLRIFAECGRPIRVLDTRSVASLEREQPLPELMVYGLRCLYHVRYDTEQAPIGARKVTDPLVVAEAVSVISTLWDRAESVLTYARREIDPLGAPEYAR